MEFRFIAPSGGGLDRGRTQRSWPPAPPPARPALWEAARRACAVGGRRKTAVMPCLLYDSYHFVHFPACKPSSFSFFFFKSQGKDIFAVGYTLKGVPEGPPASWTWQLPYVRVGERWERLGSGVGMWLSLLSPGFHPKRWGKKSIDVYCIMYFYLYLLYVHICT